ncbi:hypothetical protein IJ531_04515 [bacterium]|nr:hypothetical protein [bacterium]
MITADCIMITLRGVKYQINVEKLKMILSILDNRKITTYDERELKALMRKYLLYDEGFLENINKI